MRSFVRTVAAGEETTIAAKGRVVFLRSSTAGVIVSARSVEVGKKDGTDITVPLSARQKLRTPNEFDSVTIRNATVGSVALEVLIGNGDYDAPLSEVSVAGPNTGISSTHVAALAINATDNIATRPTRASLVVFALPTNTEYLHVGPTAADDEGYPLPPGGSYEFRGTEAVQVHNPSTNAATQGYGYIEEYTT